ncbi:DMT family transporter [bacterium]|nr:DMT family transporter [bacterium]
MPTSPLTAPEAGGAARHRAGIVMLLAAVIIWGWTFVATKVLLLYCNPGQLLGLRMLLGLLTMLALARIRAVPLRIAPGAWPALIGGALILPVHFYVQIVGLSHTSATNTGWILAVSPLLIILATGLLHSEPLGWRVWLGLAGASAGLLLLVSRGDPMGLSFGGHLGDWLVLSTACTWALYTLVTRRLPAGQHPLATSLCVMTPMGLVSIAYTGASLPFDALLEWPAEAWLALVFLGILGIGIAHWFWQEGVQRVGAARAGMLLYLEPLSTLALAVPYLHEQVGWYTWVGGGLILGAVLLAETKQ